ncbi:sensor histidine kinase [Sphingomonas jaspsi]|uniref:sensor histidine kinase n=1 Tax=Sphingomonas jaspsi TaxID=392409 RepID=UPI0004B31864|nr:histidine kinase [Sphingomonas jaspsi]
MPTTTITSRPALFADWRLAAQSIVAFWMFYLVTVLLRGLLGPDAVSAMNDRVINAIVGIGLTALIYLALRTFARDGSIRRMAFVAALASLPAAVILSALSIKLAIATPMTEQQQITTQEGVAIVQRGNNVRIVQGDGNELEVNLPPVEQIIGSKMPRLIADGTVTWYFLFAAWCAFFIAMTEQKRTRAAEARVAAAETAAHAAQVRALRYQVNPHFLFNTLNSLSSLVMSGRSDRAEDMLMALSTFFRTSLSIDPSADVSLAEEISLQRLYLDIEKVRFPERLKVSIDIPKELEDARVPALILQPLVENAIKYGVSTTTSQVDLIIRARPLDGGRMQLDVTNRIAGTDPATTPTRPTHEGTGTGLSNVCQRLAAHFGADADCRFGPIPGGYTVSLALPVSDDD